MHLIVKLKISCGTLDLTEDQIEFSFGKEFDITEEKKDPLETKGDCCLYSRDDRKALSTSYVSL